MPMHMHMHRGIERRDKALDFPCMTPHNWGMEIRKATREQRELEAMQPNHVALLPENNGVLAHRRIVVKEWTPDIDLVKITKEIDRLISEAWAWGGKNGQHIIVLLDQRTETYCYCEDVIHLAPETHTGLEVGKAVGKLDTMMRLTQAAQPDTPKEPT